MTPIVDVSLDGAPVALIGKRALSGQIVESDGERADTLHLEISNYDGRIAKPATGQKVLVAVGWEEAGPAKIGEFVITEVTKTGPRAELHLTGDSADLKKTLKGQKTRSWKAPKTLGDVLKEVASDNGLQAAVHDSLGSIKIEKLIAQTGESDMHLVMRLARQYGALAKFQGGRLIFLPRGAGLTASGGQAGRVTITPNDTEGFTFTTRDRQRRAKCKAVHYDRKTGKREEIGSEAGEAGDGAPDYVHPHVFGTQLEAKHHAASRKGKFDRDCRPFHVTLAPGQVGVGPGGVVTTLGFGDDDDRDWIVKSRVFGFSSAGLVVRLACEPKEE
ncbi:contractile injection system protein, VgrG/Pvc8 family [Methylosinus sp. Sm6]|uniref:phage late control D family protein n=1 Tax=Methylosinus sp. Sm6 TaxID=2866948 RepID=UPI001C995745|nr:hypothetical protein [Methylosinus sp. Sm6]